MSNVLQKIRSGWKSLCGGDFVAFFNDLCFFIGLARFFYLGENKFFTIAPYHQRKQSLASQCQDGDESNNYRLSAENDSAIIPDLLRCMEGSNDYAYMTEEEISKHFQELLEQGSTVWVLRDETKTAGFFWTTTGDYIMPCGRRKLRLLLPENVAIIEFIFINQDYRRRGLYSNMFKRVYRLKPDTFFSCIIDSYNKVSIAAHRKLGFRNAGRVLYFVILPWNKRHWVTFCLEKTRKFFFCPKKDLPYSIRVRYE